MATIKRQELAKMSVEQLTAKKVDLQKELMKLNMQRTMGTTLENPGLVRATRKAIARIHTYLTQKNKKPVEKPAETKVTKKVTKKAVSQSKKPKEEKKTQ